MISIIIDIENITILNQVIEVNLNNDYYFKLCHLLTIGQLIKKIDFYYFQYHLINLKNCFY